MVPVTMWVTKSGAKHVPAQGSPTPRTSETLPGRSLPIDNISQKSGKVKQKEAVHYKINDIDGFVEKMTKNATPYRELEATRENWDAEFGQDMTVETPIGPVKMGENQYEKMVARGRQDNFGLFKPTLEQPDLILEDTKGALNFIKTFSNGIKYMFSVVVDKQGKNISITTHRRTRGQIKKAIQQGRMRHQTTALNTGAAAVSPHASSHSAGGQVDSSTSNIGQKSDEVKQKSETEQAKKQADKELADGPGSITLCPWASIAIISLRFALGPGSITLR